MDSRPDYYSILGVPREATAKEIKSAYKKLAMVYHMDSSTAKNALKQCKTEEEREQLVKEMNQKFSDATAAYEVLSDETKRQRYDRGEDLDGGFSGLGGFADGLFEMFGGGFGGRSRPRKCQPRVEQIVISLLDVIKGKHIKQQHTIRKSCRPCKSTGSLNTKVCDECGGRGSVMKSFRRGNMVMARNEECSACSGGGIKKTGPQCQECKGKGYQYAEKSFEFDIPAGIMDSQKIAFEGMGDEAEGCITGDFIFSISVKKDEKFSRISPVHLYLQLRVPVRDLLLQAPLAVQTIDGRILALDLPRLNGVDLGTELLAVKGEGIPSQKGGPKGSLYIRIIPDFPLAKSINKDKLRESLPTGESEEENGKSELKMPCKVSAHFVSQDSLGESGRRHEEYVDESEEEGPGQRQCTTA